MSFSRKHRRHGHVPPAPQTWPPGNTKETLVADLEAKPAQYMRDLLIKRARAGHYHDFESPLDMPKTTLVKHLEHAGYDDLAQKTRDGGYDYEPGTDEQRAEMARWFGEKEGEPESEPEPQAVTCPACGHDEPYHCGARDCPRPPRPKEGGS